MRRASKVDANQSRIVGIFRAMGCGVQSLAAVGGGVPDLLVGIKGRTVLVEVKDGTKPPSARKLTPDQVRWHGSWPDDVAVIESDEQAIDFVARLRRAGL